MSTSAERMARLRARRKEGLLPPDDGPPVRGSDDLLLPAVEASIAALGLAETDAAVAQLARQHARAIDQARDSAWTLRWIGPELQRCLEAVGGTPLARARLETTGKPGPAGPSRLDRLRQARSERHPGAS